MGLSGGDQSERINSSHSIIEEFLRSDWMGVSGGDQSGRINSSHSIIQEFAPIFLPAKITFQPVKIILPPAQTIFPGGPKKIK